MLLRLNHAFGHVRKNLIDSHEKNKEYFNRRAIDQKFEIGDPVYLFDTTTKLGHSSKLTSHWQPFYRIVECFSPVNFRINHQQTGKSKLVHAEHLRLAYPENAWDEIPDECRPVLDKFKNTKSGANAPKGTRQQPLRTCRATGSDRIESDERKTSLPQSQDRSRDHHISEPPYGEVLPGNQANANGPTSALGAGGEHFDSADSDLSDEDVPLAQLRSRLQGDRGTTEANVVPRATMKRSAIHPPSSDDEKRALTDFTLKRRPISSPDPLVERKEPDTNPIPNNLIFQILISIQSFHRVSLIVLCIVLGKFKVRFQTNY
ncbi:hypothetical protein SNE40_019997 [Patella caerulea]|uniref:Uncharacterized protein n=1 Tax=Patella caerulea TaxID=87958 RepID=A0AAN8G9P2_PATCE